MSETKSDGGKGKKKVPALEVRARHEGFRRGGRAWSKEPTTVPVAEFTKAELAAIMDEPGLVVTETEIEQ